MENNNAQASPNIQDPVQPTTQNTNADQPQSTSQPPINTQYQPHPTQYQQQQYAAYIQQQQHRYYAQQQYLLQQQRQQQYASYWQSVLKQRHQHQYAQYYQQIAQQYGYPEMLQAMNQNNHSNMSYNRSINNNNSNGQIILSSEEQPLLIASDNSKYKRRRRRKKRKISEIEVVENETGTNNDASNDNDNNYIRMETVSIDIQDDDGLGLDKDGFDKHTLINQNENLPNINTEFDQWLYFTKKLWKRQKKYKNFVIPHINSNMKQNKKNNKKDATNLTESISTSEDSLPPDKPCDHTLQINSAFLKDRARMKLKNQKVLKNKSAVNVMIKMGLAPPWNQMSKYKKWSKCFRWNQKRNK
eukprot:120232_1